MSKLKAWFFSPSLVLKMKLGAFSTVSKWSTIVLVTALSQWGDTMTKTELIGGLLTVSGGEFVTFALHA